MGETKSGNFSRKIVNSTHPSTDLLLSCHCCHYHHVAVDVVAVWGLGDGGKVLGLAALLPNNMFCCRMVSHFCSSEPEIAACLVLSCHWGHYHPAAVDVVVVWGLGGGGNMLGLAPLLPNNIFCCRMVSHFCSSEPEISEIGRSLAIATYVVNYWNITLLWNPPEKGMVCYWSVITAITSVIWWLLVKSGYFESASRSHELLDYSVMSQ